MQKFNFEDESYWQLLMGVTGNVESGQGKFFTPTFNCHISCNGGVTKKKEVQHAKKTRVPQSSKKDRIPKEEEEET